MAFIPAAVVAAMEAIGIGSSAMGIGSAMGGMGTAAAGTAAAGAAAAGTAAAGTAAAISPEIIAMIMPEAVSGITAASATPSIMAPFANAGSALVGEGMGAFAPELAGAYEAGSMGTAFDTFGAERLLTLPGELPELAGPAGSMGTAFDTFDVGRLLTLPGKELPTGFDMGKLAKAFMNANTMMNAVNPPSQSTSIPMPAMGAPQKQPMRQKPPGEDPYLKLLIEKLQKRRGTGGIL